MNDFFIHNPWVFPLFFLILGVFGIGLKADDNEKRINKLEDEVRKLRR